MTILDTQTFRWIMYFKFFMVIAVWGLVPLVIPKNFIPFLGLELNDIQIFYMRIWGCIVLADFFLYLSIFKNPTTTLSARLMLFAVLDNAGLGILLLILTPIYHFPWGIWINIPFQLFFGYWFWKFYQANITLRATSKSKN